MASRNISFAIGRYFSRMATRLAASADETGGKGDRYDVSFLRECAFAILENSVELIFNRSQLFGSQDSCRIPWHELDNVPKRH
jgi:hypothetical protein